MCKTTNTLLKDLTFTSGHRSKNFFLNFFNKFDEHINEALVFWMKFYNNATENEESTQCDLGLSGGVLFYFVDLIVLCLSFLFFHK